MCLVCEILEGSDSPFKNLLNLFMYALFIGTSDTCFGDMILVFGQFQSYLQFRKLTKLG